MNNDTGGDHPMPGTRMRRLFDENLSMIETMTRIEIRRLGRMPRGTHLGQDDGNPVTDLLPDRYLDRYDREFLYRMLGSTIRLRARLADPKTDHAAHSVIEEILISRAVRLVADDDNENGRFPLTSRRDSTRTRRSTSWKPSEDTGPRWRSTPGTRAAD